MSDFRYSDSNFGEPEPVSNRPETVLGIVITFMLISWVCVFLRLYVRSRIVHALGWDDLCCGLYLLSTTAGSIAICASIKYGLGKHFLMLQQWQWRGYLQTFYVANATYVTSTALIKEALLLQYLRIYSRGSFLYRFTMFLAVFTALWGLAYSFLAWVPCIPVRQYWDAEEGALCYAYGSPDPAPFLATYQSHTIINMTLDLLVLLIPSPLFFKEGQASATRLRLVGLLSIGALVIAFAIWRFVTIIEHRVATFPTRDPTWYSPISILLAVLEIDAASVCASVPIFWPVLSSQWGKIFVTKEVNITRETRYMDEDEDRLTRGTTRSRTGSDIELTDGKPSSRNAKETHYRDSYILSQVDPLRRANDQVEVSALGESLKGSSRKWISI
ncbi:hypothetical protein F4779DRAFT_587783 [Xylariaceae sp. FL0662B]|nr:hypothetical protein F4779DRAFT_587783 [Xylariaceae sp. FL0662B]